MISSQDLKAISEWMLEHIDSVEDWDDGHGTYQDLSLYENQTEIRPCQLLSFLGTRMAPLQYEPGEHDLFEDGCKYVYSYGMQCGLTCSRERVGGKDWCSYHDHPIYTVPWWNFDICKHMEELEATRKELGETKEQLNTVLKFRENFPAITSLPGGSDYEQAMERFRDNCSLLKE